MRDPSAERGATALMVAASMMLLIGFASLAIDAGIGLGDRRGAQNAADLAALAAAWQECNADTTGRLPREVARDTAADNGYDDLADPQVQVDADPEASGWKVVITGSLDTTLGRATPYAPDTLEVTAEATAECIRAGILDGHAVFAQGSSCPVTLDGTTVLDVSGRSHSNQDVTVSSGTLDSITYRGIATLGAGVSATKYFGSAKEYPEDIRTYSPPAADFTFTTDIDEDAIVNHIPPLGAVLPGGTLEITEPGIYHTDGNVVLDDITLGLAAATDGVTFVADGTIQIRDLDDFVGHAPLASPAGPALAFYADGGNCGTPSIQIGDGVFDDVELEGVAFARNGTILIKAEEVDISGSLVGVGVDVTGETVTIIHVDDPSIPPTFEVNLVG